MQGGVACSDSTSFEPSIRKLHGWQEAASVWNGLKMRNSKGELIVKMDEKKLEG